MPNLEFAKVHRLELFTVPEVSLTAETRQNSSCLHIEPQAALQVDVYTYNNAWHSGEFWMFPYQFASQQYLDRSVNSLIPCQKVT